MALVPIGIQPEWLMAAALVTAVVAAWWLVKRAKASEKITLIKFFTPTTSEMTNGQIQGTSVTCREETWSLLDENGMKIEPFQMRTKFGYSPYYIVKNDALKPVSPKVKRLPMGLEREILTGPKMMGPLELGSLLKNRLAIALMNAKIGDEGFPWMLVLALGGGFVSGTLLGIVVCAMKIIKV